MSAWLDGQLQRVGVTTKLVDLGKHVMDGQELPLPPAILGRIGNDPNKKTILVYGHYDVQPVSLLILGRRMGDEPSYVGPVERWLGHGAVQACCRREDGQTHRAWIHRRQGPHSGLAERPRGAQGPRSSFARQHAVLLRGHGGER